MKFESVISEANAKGEQVGLAFDHNGDQLQLEDQIAWRRDQEGPSFAHYVFLIRLVSVSDGCPFRSGASLLWHTWRCGRALCLESSSLWVLAKLQRLLGEIKLKMTPPTTFCIAVRPRRSTAAAHCSLRSKGPMQRSNILLDCDPDQWDFLALPQMTIQYYNCKLL